MNNISTEENPIHQYSDTAYYDVSLIAMNDIGCTDTVKQGPLMVINNANYFIPNAFTPDNNGTNDVFYVYGPSLKTVHLRVFDRWGEMVFESTEQHDGWDGTYHGKPLNTGVFMYIAEMETLTGKQLFAKGDVTLIR